MDLEILDEIPASASDVKHFAPAGFPLAPVGLVVRFTADGGRSFIGSFRRGSGSFDAALPHPNGVDAIVIAGGWGFIVEMHPPESARSFRSRVIGVFTSIAHRLVVLMYEWFAFEAFGPRGARWKTGTPECVSARDVVLDASRITGLMLVDGGEEWTRFEVDLETGRTSGVMFVLLLGATDESSDDSNAG